MTIDETIRAFSVFLNNSWDTLMPLLSGRPYATDESSKSDWLQSNWEMLVERKVLQLNEYLEVYGEGADFNGKSSRITDIESVPTHSVKVLIDGSKDILNNLEIEDGRYDFERLVGFENGFYTSIPPFNFALVQDEGAGIERVFPLEEIRFELQLV
ncbi:hypothetical protein [Chitinophaga sp.]|uniref:hypothetical protein n=1 Tax=Chitinophaga sp. TaxID=1869181 RepID=UPI0031DB906C